MTTKHPRFRILGLSFLIAIIIFVTSVFSNLSVQMYTIATEQKNTFVGVGISFLTIFSITILVWFAFICLPPLKKAMMRMFGIDENVEKEENESQKQN
ncbi:MAG: hypothetical protein ABSB71_13055 [Candidatus Bathyarchaeia archaeon]|jgi:Mg2+/Co2+ transporter CorB